MSRDSPHDLPPALREALTEERADDGGRDAPTFEALWDLLGPVKPPSSALPDASDTWADVRRNLDSDAAPPDTNATEARARRPPRSRVHHRRVRWRWGVAAIVLLVVAVGAWLWQRPVAVTAAPGTSVTRTLPDGSVVELNGGTRLTYPRTMSTLAFLEDQRRTVHLQGEAYFEVRSADRPFVVRTQTARIEVVSTAFAVRTNVDGRKTHVALAEGTVRVRSASMDTVTLQAGEAVHVGKEGLVSPPADTSIRRVTAWRRGGFAVTAKPLPAVVRALERQFGTPIRLSSKLSPKVTSSPLTLYYSQDVNVETILHDLSVAQGLSYRPTAQGYVIAPSNRTRQPTEPDE
ncbi:MAG: FecR family protein [Salinibacter sp.]|uniref:FecR family protein n=1 Tax=Salinibacter sp. TaxID=2065818 RepID=UPI0035D47933